MTTEVSDLAAAPRTIDSQLNNTIHLQRTAFLKKPYPDARLRKDRLRRLRKLVAGHLDEMCAAIDRDFQGRNHWETKAIEGFTALQCISYGLRNIKGWMRPQSRKTAIWFLPASNTLFYQPLGVVGIIVPWNCPLYLSVSPMVSAIAAGNNVMIKMPEQAPAFSDCFAKLIRQYFDASEIAVITGDINVGRAFASLNFDKLLFTGSAQTGKKVMAAAANNLTPVVLELGGKSPAIIDEDFDIMLAAQRLVSGKLCNAGQICMAPDHVYVPENKLKAFEDALQLQFNAQFTGWEELTGIVNEQHYSRLRGMIEDAIEKGATVKWLGKKTDLSNRKLPLITILNVTDDMRVAREEIFGPILPIYSYTDLEKTLRHIREGERPLALYFFGKKNATHAIRETFSGGMTLNDTHLHVIQDQMPFGGIGNSGMGHYHGQEGFKTFSHAKAVFKQRRLTLTTLLKPPYTPFRKFVIKIMLKL